MISIDTFVHRNQLKISIYEDIDRFLRWSCTMLRPCCEITRPRNVAVFMVPIDTKHLRFLFIVPACEKARTVRKRLRKKKIQLTSVVTFFRMVSRRSVRTVYSRPRKSVINNELKLSTRSNVVDFFTFLFQTM